MYPIVSIATIEQRGEHQPRVIAPVFRKYDAIGFPLIMGISEYRSATATEDLRQRQQQQPQKYKKTPRDPFASSKGRYFGISFIFCQNIIATIIKFNV